MKKPTLIIDAFHWVKNRPFILQQIYHDFGKIDFNLVVTIKPLGLAKIIKMDMEFIKRTYKKPNFLFGKEEK